MDREANEIGLDSNNLYPVLEAIIEFNLIYSELFKYNIDHKSK